MNEIDSKNIMAEWYSVAGDSTGMHTFYESRAPKFDLLTFDK